MDPDHQREGPDSVAAEIRAGGIEALPARVDRYGKAKTKALDVAEHISRQHPELEAVGLRVSGCGEWLAFRHYYTVDEVRLHGASFCMKHLLCPLCAIRRGAKSLKAYLDRWDALRASNPALRPFLVTLTVKDGDDLAERFKHLHDSQRELWKQKHRGRHLSPLAGVLGAVWSYEVKRGSGSKSWHPHLHMIALAEQMPSQSLLREAWHSITGDSFIVDVRPITGDPVEGFMEVFKYAVKFSDQDVADTVHAFKVLRGKRLLASAGLFRGVEIPADLTDEPLEGLPYIERFYRYLHGAKGYTLARCGDSPGEAPAPKVSQFVRIMTARGSGGAQRPRDG